MSRCERNGSTEWLILCRLSLWDRVCVRRAVCQLCRALGVRATEPSPLCVCALLRVGDGERLARH